MDKGEGGENGLGWLDGDWMEDGEVRHGLGLLNGWKGGGSGEWIELS